MKLYNLIYDLALCEGANCANINNFCDYVTKGLNNIDITTQEDFEFYFKKIKNSLYINNSTINMQNAQKYNVFRDLSNMNEHNINVIPHCDMIKELHSHASAIVRVLKNINLNVDNNDIKIYITDKYPHPFETLTGNAIAPDFSDNKKYNIPIGIYFKQDKLSSLQSKLLLAHEIIHICFAKKGSELLSRGLEEGICELLGSLYCNAKLFNTNIAINYIKFRRLKYNNTNQKFRIYTDYLKMAYLLYERVGINGLVNIVNQGRENIKRIENLIANNKIDSINVPMKPQKDVILDNLASYILLGIPENEVVSSLSYYIIDKYNGEKNIKTLLKNLNIPFSLGYKAVSDIQKRIFGWIISDDTIEYSDINTIKNNNSLRYELLME